MKSDRLRFETRHVDDVFFVQHVMGQVGDENCQDHKKI